MPNPGQFDYTPGGNKNVDIKNAINNIQANTLINSALTGSITISGSTVVTGNISQTGSISVTGSIVTNIVTFTTASGALPLSQPTWSMVVSGSGAAAKIYLYNGTNWMTSSWSVI